MATHHKKRLFSIIVDNISGITTKSANLRYLMGQKRFSNVFLLRYHKFFTAKFFFHWKWKQMG